MVRPLSRLSALLWLAGGLALGAFAVGCSDAARDAAPAKVSATANANAAPAQGAIEQGHTLSYVFERPKSLNPFTTLDGVARMYVHGFTHDALLDLDPQTGEARGALAERWQLDAAGTTLTCTLRDGVRFADGSPLTLDDVRYTYAIATARGGAIQLGQIHQGMSLVASAEFEPGPPITLRIKLKSPHVDAPLLVGKAWVVCQRRWFETRIAELARAQGIAAPGPDDEGFDKLLAQIVDMGPGTGAYQLPLDANGRADWSSELRLARNEHSWARRARPGTWNLGGIRIRWLAAPAQLAALRERTLDVYQPADIDQLLQSFPDLKSDYRKVVYEPSHLNVYLVQWNLRRPGLGDVRVRQALAMLFDRAQIVQGLLNGNGTPAVAYARPDRPGYPRDLAPPPFDPAGARRLLREAGFDARAGKPLRLVVLAPAENPLFRQMLDLLAEAARDAGVDLQPQALENRSLGDRLAGGDWDGALFNKRDLNPSCDPTELFASTGAANNMGWASAEADRLLAQQSVEHDAAARRSLLDHFHALVAREQPVTFLVHPRAALLINSHLQNAEPGPLGLWPERFWMPKAHQRD